MEKQQFKKGMYKNHSHSQRKRNDIKGATEQQQWRQRWKNVWHADSWQIYDTNRNKQHSSHWRKNAHSYRVGQMHVRENNKKQIFENILNVNQTIFTHIQLHMAELNIVVDRQKFGQNGHRNQHTRTQIEESSWQYEACNTKTKEEKTSTDLRNMWKLVAFGREKEKRVRKWKKFLEST